MTNEQKAEAIVDEFYKRSGKAHKHQTEWLKQAIKKEMLRQSSWGTWILIALLQLATGGIFGIIFTHAYYSL